MFTNNFIKYTKQFALNTNQSYTIADGAQKTGKATTFYDGGFVRWMGYGRCQAIKASQTGGASNSLAGSQVYPGIYFGTGSTPASKADYTLESVISSGLTITNPTALAWNNDSNGKYEAVADFAVRNTKDSEIHIYEIGLFLPIETGGSSLMDLTWHNALMERTVLTEPITIAPGESKLVTYKITFNQTLNVE